jgi:hypothetical protein
MATPDEANSSKRRQMIAEAAYFRAEKYGFRGGDALRDWCEAEADVDTQLRARARDAQPEARRIESKALAVKG